MKEQVKAKSAKNKLSKPAVVIMIIVQLFISLLLCVALVFHTNCFSTVKKYVISSLWETGSHRYIARMLLSAADIKKLTSTSTKKEVQTITPTKIAAAGKTDVKIFSVNDTQSHHYSGYVVEVKDPSRIKVAMTDKVGIEGIFTSAVAKKNGAIAAINGGGYHLGFNAQDSANTPTCFVIENGKVKWNAPDFTNYDTTVNVIALDKKGCLIVGERSINYLKNHNVQEAVTFPNVNPLIVNGVGQCSDDSSDSRSPRTVIAQKKDGTILLVVLDGRQIGMLGATYYEVQEMLLKEFSTQNNPVITATPLDGGGSTTLYYKGKIWNHPTGMYGERAVASAFYVQP